MPHNPFDNYFDSGVYGNPMPRRTYDPTSGGNPYVGQYRARGYEPSSYQPSYNQPTYERYANQRPATYNGSSARDRYRHDQYDNDSRFYGSGAEHNYNARRDPELYGRRVQFRDGSDSDIPSYQLNPTSLRGADGSSIASRRHRSRYEPSYDTASYHRRADEYEETFQPRSRHTIYTTPRRRDVVAGWFTRGRNGDGGYDARCETDDDEIYRRVRHLQEPAEQPRRSGFHRPSWLSRW